MTSEQPEATQSLFSRYSILCFILLTTAISWGALFILNDPGNILSKFGPSLAGMIMALVVGGGAGLTALLKRLTIWNVGIQWYAIAFLGPALLWLIAIFIGSSIEGVPVQGDLSQLTTFIALFAMAAFLGGGLGEELGWRGFMLPKLQERWSPLMSSLLIGVVWGLWHAPVFFMGDAARDGGLVSLALFTILTICLSVIFTWVFNSTRGGLIIPVILHGAFNATENTFENVFPIMEESGITFIYGGLVLLTAIVLILVRRKARLTHSINSS